MTKWTKEYRAAYMRAYYRANRDWIRTNWKLWYARNRESRNLRRRKARKETIHAGA